MLQEELSLEASSAPSIAIVTDESSDAQDRYILHILFIPQVKLPSTAASSTSTATLSPSTSAQLNVLCVDIIQYIEEVN